jgi:4-oxalomesaconate tautomerase
MQKSIPYMQFRGGSSKGLFFKATDLPADEKERNRIVLAAMEGVGNGDPRQIDGLGGATSLTSKAAIISKSENPAADLDYLFLQVVVGKGHVSTTQTCGNILAAVVPFAIESGIIAAGNNTTSAKVNMVNTGGICEVTVETPNGKVNYAGNAKVDGVPGTAAPIVCNYLETVGSTCGSLLPTGNAIDIINGTEVTCIDNGMPVVLMRAGDFNLKGDESKEALEASEPLKQKIEQIRLEAGVKMNLGDVNQQTIPKMCLISAPQQGGVLNTRMFIPHVVHDAIGVLAAVSVATACIVPGTVAEGIAEFEKGAKLFSIEHPTGEFTVNLDYELKNGKLNIIKSGVIRTARFLSRGEVFIPASFQEINSI